MPKSIIVLADGTGNSSGTFTRTNVWRLYRALDLGSPPVGEPQQIAYYHDGVGTNSFKLLTLLGGAFGWGLKRNVIELYEFICRNYEDGDHIYAFGFSRGAFTARVLIGIIAQFGLVHYTTDAELHRAAIAVYRENRTRFEGPALTSIFRILRHHTLKAKRGLLRLAPPAPATIEVKRIAFAGMWETVAAYGMPILELTRGIDRCIWPMDLPSLELSEKVTRARQALALDEARETFHPMPWDEVHEQKLIRKDKVAADRLRQVWFAGVHADIGGGYADDELAYVALDWMMEEAGPRTTAAGGLGLRYVAGAHQRVKDAIAVSAPLHDSRSGLGSYYRYQPRRIRAFVDKPPPDTLIRQDPDLKGRGLLLAPLIHHTVFERIARGPDAYAPISLPNRYQVVGANGDASFPSGAPQAPLPPLSGDPGGQPQNIWDLVWWRRTLYFLTVYVSIAFAVLPFALPTTTCAGPQCLASPLINFLGLFLPGFASAWVASYSQHSGAFLLMAVAVLILRTASLWTQTRLHDRTRSLWQGALPVGPLLPSAGASVSLLARVRTSAPYQRLLHCCKWEVLPWAFGLSLIFLSAVILLLWPVNRALIAIGEHESWYCRSDMTAQASFATKDTCTKVQFVDGIVSVGQKYRLTLKITDPWGDDTIDTDPTGFGFERMSLLGRLGTLMRRSLNDRWFQPIVKIIPTDKTNESRSLPLEMRLDDSLGLPPSYSTEFEAPTSGELFIYVNDALTGWPGFGPDFYSNNRGTADINVIALHSKHLEFGFPWKEK